MKLLLFAFVILTIPIIAQITERDTLRSGTDSISVFNERSIFEQIEVTLKDTTGGSAITDSFYVERYDPRDLSWHKIGARNTLNWVSEEVLVPGNGATKTWIVYDFKEFAWYLRVRRINGASTAGTYVAGVKSMVTWTGKH